MKNDKKIRKTNYYVHATITREKRMLFFLCQYDGDIRK